MIVADILMGVGLLILCAICVWAGFHIGRLTKEKHGT